MNPGGPEGDVRAVAYPGKTVCRGSQGRRVGVAPGQIRQEAGTNALDPAERVGRIAARVEHPPADGVALGRDGGGKDVGVGREGRHRAGRRARPANQLEAETARDEGSGRGNGSGFSGGCTREGGQCGDPCGGLPAERGGTVKADHHAAVGGGGQRRGHEIGTDVPEVLQDSPSQTEPYRPRETRHHGTVARDDRGRVVRRGIDVAQIDQSLQCRPAEGVAGSIEPRGRTGDGGAVCGDRKGPAPVAIREVSQRLDGCGLHGENGGGEAGTQGGETRTNDGYPVKATGLARWRK